MSRLTKKQNIQKSRRQFLIGTAGGGLMMAFAPVMAAVDKLPDSASSRLGAKQFEPTIWFNIDESGQILINITKAEMGQHVGTALARIVADELGADWDDVAIRYVATDPKWGMMVTGGSWSVWQSFLPLSQAGAAGRTALIEAGARLLGVDAATCHTSNSEVVCPDQAISFAEIVKTGQIDRVFTAEELAKFEPKDPSERKLIAKNTQALDIPAKTDGSAKYGIDIELDGMLYARPIVPPTRYGSKVLSVDDSAAKKIGGYQGFHQLQDPSGFLQGWVTVVADSYYAAVKAGNVLKVEYEAGETAGVSEHDILVEGERLARDKSTGGQFVEEGNIDTVAAQAGKTIEGLYRTSSALHFHLEPVNAAVEFKDGVCHVHTGNQWQSLFLPVVAKALGMSDDKVVIHQYYLGGGFGRRLAGDYMIPAALTAQAVGKPVKLIFTREDDSRFDCIRSASVQHFSAYWDQDDHFTGIDQATVAGWPTLAMAPAFMPDSIDKKAKVDPFSINGADHWYSLDHHRVRAVNNELAQKTFMPGWLRAVGPGWIAWGVESFMDEVALTQGVDPLAFRLSLLDGKGKNAGEAPASVGGAKRLANVLKQASLRSDWGRELPANEGLGVAVAAGQERAMPTWCACVAHVRVNPTNGEVKVLKLTTVIDCGTIIHPDGALAQTQGSMLWGLSLALFEGTKIADGQVADTNLHSYTPLRMADVPDMDISFIDSIQFPVGLGEPGLIAVAPAIGNAIFDAVGARVRDLPIRADAVLAALS